MDDEDDKSRTFTPNLTLKKRSIRVLCGYLGMKYQGFMDDTRV